MLKKLILFAVMIICFLILQNTFAQARQLNTEEKAVVNKLFDENKHVTPDVYDKTTPDEDIKPQQELARTRFYRFFTKKKQKPDAEQENKIVPVPPSQMNDPKLQAKMLNLAKKKYPQMEVTKIVIVESEWRPDYHLLTRTKHRSIRTKMIHKKGSGYNMVTLNFIEPHLGNGKYGEAQIDSIGTDYIAVDYKP